LWGHSRRRWSGSGLTAITWGMQRDKTTGCPCWQLHVAASCETNDTK
jgi:hypothetical protein